jgi:hypothetical protein
MSTKGISLFLFGGVAEMKKKPPILRAEFMMAIPNPMEKIAANLRI